jgi:hypothetical protein
MRNLSVGPSVSPSVGPSVSPTALATRPAPAPRSSCVPENRAGREYVSKLVLHNPQDHHLLEAIGGYPARLQSCVLTAWLREGWRRAGTRPGAQQPIPPPVPSLVLPAARLTRRIRFDDPADPALARFLASLPRKERGREIRNFISVALRGQVAGVG